MTTKLERYTLEPFTAYPNEPVFTNSDDLGKIYTIEIRQKGIVYATTIEIILDYNKDYPSRLFQSFEIYYGDELIAKNSIPEYLTGTRIQDKKSFYITDLFPPDYFFIVDTTEKPLTFKFTRKPIKGIVNDIKITYARNPKDTPNKPVNIKHFKSLIAPLFKHNNMYKYSMLVEHEPISSISHIVKGHLTNENYSDKPIQECETNIISHYIDDMRVETYRTLQGMNVYFVKFDSEIDEPLYAVMYYTY